MTEKKPDWYKNLKTEIGMYGDSPENEETIRVISTVAPTDLSVLIIGESGDRERTCRPGLTQSEPPKRQTTHIGQYRCNS